MKTFLPKKSLIISGI